MSTESTAIFADRGYSMDEILQQGALGGAAALLSYLETRRAQLTRRLSAVGAEDPTRDRLTLAIAAIKRAETLVPKLTQMGHTMQRPKS